MSGKAKPGSPRPGLLGCLVPAGAGCLALGAFLLLRGRPGFGDAVKEHFSLPVRRALGRVCALVPFSVTEALVTLAVLGLLAFLVVTAVKLCRGPRRGRTLLRRLGALALAALWVLTGFCWLYGADYYARSFSQRAGLDPGPVETAALARTTRYFARLATALSETVPRDGAGVSLVSWADLQPGWPALYEAVEAEYPFLARPSLPPKALLSSRLMSRMGFTGVYFPFTGETGINVDAPAAGLAFTVAHELAHQRGVTSELECNFLGVLACLGCGDPLYRYSGALMGLSYLLSALYGGDRAAWRQVWQDVGPLVQADLQAGADYWAALETKVTEVSEKVYDVYLQSNGQSSGIRSYGECVNLLVRRFPGE